MNRGGFALDLDPVISNCQLIRHRADNVQRLAIFEFPIRLSLLLVFSCGTLSRLTIHYVKRLTAIVCLQLFTRKTVVGALNVACCSPSHPHVTPAVFTL